jgi:hypothetical protein
MRCTTGPRLIADERGWSDVVFGGDQRIRAPLSRFHFRSDGTLCFRGELPRGVRSHEEAADSEQPQALRMKRRYAAAGLASLDDSMYWSLVVLRDHPAIAHAVAGPSRNSRSTRARTPASFSLPVSMRSATPDGSARWY